MYSNTVNILVIALGLGTAAVHAQKTSIPPPPGYTLTDLGSLGGNATSANAINNAGDVAGYSYTNTGQPHAFLWSKHKMTDLGTLGGNTSQASGINSQKQIVGWSATSNGSTHAFSWLNGVMKDLGTLGGANSYATAINDASQIVGYSTTSSGQTHAFLVQNGVMTDLGTLLNLSTSASFAYGISKTGQIVGQSDSTAVIWEALPTFPVLSAPLFIYRLPTLQPDSSQSSATALGINSVGQVVGGDFNDAANPGFNVVTIWDVAGIHPTSGEETGNGYGINDKGQVVGTLEFHMDFNRAFVANQDVVTELFPDHNLSSNSQAINNRGQIVGSVSNQILTPTKAGP